MLVHDDLVQVHRATVDDAAGIAALHEATTREAVWLARGHRDRVRTTSGSTESVWRNTLKLASDDHRPWVARLADRTVGFVSAGPSRDADATPQTGELYVIDFDFGDGHGAGARALLHHACRDLKAHGFVEVTLWVVARDQQTRSLLAADNWCEDDVWRRDRISGIPILEYRYRKALT